MTSSISTSDHLRVQNTISHRRWLLWTFVVGFCIVGLVELNYRYGIRCPRHEIDAKILDIEREAGKDFRVALFSDSPTHNPARSFEMAPDVLDLTTTNGPTLLGIKFMLQRIYSGHGTIGEAIIFIRPEFFNADPSRAAPGIFLWFNRDEELAELFRYGAQGYVSYEIYMRNRLDALNIVNLLLTDSRLKKEPFDGRYSLERGIVTNRVHTVAPADFGATPQAQKIAHAIVDLCIKHKTRVTFILEPLTVEDHAHVGGSPMDVFFRHLASTSQDVRYVDAYDLGNFSDDAFFDGCHPRANWGKYYLSLVDQKVTRIF